MNPRCRRNYGTVTTRSEGAPLSAAEDGLALSQRRALCG